jgi:hypothetical protein
VGRDYEFGIFVGLVNILTLGRPMIIADINALHCKSSKSRWGKRHCTDPATSSPGVVMTTDFLPVISHAVATGHAHKKAMGCPAANSVRARPF